MNPQEAKKLEDKVQNTLKTHLKPNSIIIAGISGGPDSIFLLLILLEAQKRLSKLKIIVAHINHCLRSKESENDAKYVKNIAQTHNLTHHTKKVDIKALSQKSGKGIEETARKTRYSYFKHLAKKYNADFIATAHHADDNLETILLIWIPGHSARDFGCW